MSAAPTPADAQLEVLTMGRISADIYPEQVGVALEDVTSFAKYLGGSATNVAVAAARHGRHSAVVTRVGSDPFGRFCRRELRRYGVSDRFVTTDASLKTPLTFCEIFPPDDFPLYFYREPKAPDLEIRTEDLDLEAIRTADVFWVTVTGLSQEPSRTATLAALEERTRVRADAQGDEDRRGITVLDLDYRPMFWPRPEEATVQVQRALQHVTVAVGNREECEVATGEHDPAAAADALRKGGVDLAVVKLGPDGVLAADGGGPIRVPPVPVDVRNGLGAGDAFGGALCHGLLSGWDLERTVRFANTAGAIVAGELSCSEAMPTSEQVEARLAEVGRR